MDSSKIDLVNIEEASDTSGEVLKLSEIYWKDYLEEQDYNQDVNKMCELCIEDQIAKYGSQTIPCTGLLTAPVQLGGHWDELLKNSTEADLKIYESLVNAYSFMDAYCDTPNIGTDKRVFKGRWYQEQLLQCSARSKVVRMRKKDW